MVSAKVKSSTIIEVIIAMVIIVIIFGIAMMIYGNVMRSSLSVKKIRAEAILNEFMQAAERDNDFSHRLLTVDELSIVEDVKSYQNENLLEIDLVAFDNNQEKVAELHKIIMNSHE